MKHEYLIVLGAVGVSVAAALGVGVSSQALLDESLETSVNAGVQAGLVATLIVLGVEYTRER